MLLTLWVAPALQLTLLYLFSTNWISGENNLSIY